jgi:hypothetical protein
VDEFRALYEGDQSMLKVADIYEAYDREKSKKFMMDFDDLLVETYHILTNDQEVRDKYRGTFRHLLVDEFQDVNPLQQSIFKILVDDSGNGASFFVVGDDWQSIYGFTGASVANIINFQEAFPGAAQLWNSQSTEDLIKQCKVPLVGWTEFKTRLPTEQEVESWFNQWPDANIGVVTGKISGIVVFDLDSEDAVQYADDRGGFPGTAKVKTGKGYHIYCQHPGFEMKNNTNQELKIDIKTDGGYVVAPPSIHGSGRQYEWENGYSIFDLDPAPCESWMIDYLKSISAESTAKPKEKGDPKTPQNPPGTGKTMAEDDWVQLLKNGCQEGMRNQSATKLAGHFLAKGLAESEVWEILSQWNSKNSPPINHSELRRTFERLRVDNILSNLTGLAKKYNIPMVAISELARDSYKSGQRLGMASFKESGTIEYEASWLGILAAVEEKNGGYNLKNDWERIIEHDGNVDLIVFKAKRGTGITGKIPLKVNRDKMTVTDREDASVVDTIQAVSRPSMFGARRN